MINLVMLTGFLGAGKTTCLSNILEAYRDRDEKIGVIVNEFGQESIDGQIIKDKEMDMVELTDGSIFCACIQENFIDALCQLLDADISYLFIEATGLADHSNIANILETVKKIKNKGYNYVGSICVVDSVYFLKQLDLLVAIKRQIEYSDAIVVNKIDLVDDEEVLKIENRIKELNDKARIIKSSFCDFDVLDIINNIEQIGKEASETTNTVENRLQSYVISFKELPKHDDLLKFSQELTGSSLRLKGFVETDQGNYQLDCVNTIFKINEWEQDIEDSKLVIISDLGPSLISRISKLAKENNIEIKLKL